jgi:hypothetical protein
VSLVINSRLKSLLPFGGKLYGNNRLIKLHALIPWDELEDDYTA